MCVSVFSVTHPGSGRSPRREDVLNDLVSHLEDGDIEETMARVSQSIC